LLRRAADRLGVATLPELAGYYRFGVAFARAAVDEAGLVPVKVEGSDAKHWASPARLDELRAGFRGRHRTTLLSPFDSLVWNRDRTERIFGFTHRLEAYVPRPNRVHGYFVMPLLAGGRLVGRVDPGRSGRTLVARRVSVTPAAVGAMASALKEAAAWVGCDDVVVEVVDPSVLFDALVTELKRG
jgi:uncharacterized protein YcaQ